MRAGWVCILVSLICAILPVRAAWADDDGFSPKVQALLRGEVAKHPEIFARWKTCPADIAGTYKPVWDGLLDKDAYSTGFCAANPERCLSACFQQLNGDACFTIASGMQDEGSRRYARLWEAMYAFSCALGHAGGCTNRAAGILQGNFPKDPMARKKTAARACTYRTFARTCADEDAWGCTMLGQAYHYGEGVGISLQKARAAYALSCSLSPDFSACSFGKGRLRDMDAGR